jgi:UDPglucose 6-dehydrogenase
MHIAVIGGGYVGLVTAACFADLGHRVSVIETDPSRLRTIMDGKPPFFEPGLTELLADVTQAGSLAGSGEASAVIGASELVFICVGTPLGADGEADLSQVQAASAAVADSGSDVPVVFRSTLPIGSTGRLSEWLRRENLDTVVTNPEFLRQGTAISDFMRPTRVVIGTRGGARTVVAEIVSALYEPLGAPLLITDFASAEMIKNVANAFLATRLSFINEVSDLCEAYGADIDAVVEGIGMDPRIGRSYFRPGIGFGGSCLPKELANLVRLGQRQGLAMPLMEGVGRANDGRATRVTDRLEGLLGSFRDRTIGMLGLAFKPGTDDVRYSPAIALARRLLERGAHVLAHDPVVPLEATASLSGLRRCARAEGVFAEARLVILATEWGEYRELDWHRLAASTASPVLFDGRNALDHQELSAAGWEVIAVGRAGV